MLTPGGLGESTSSQELLHPLLDDGEEVWAMLNHVVSEALEVWKVSTNPVGSCQASSFPAGTGLHASSTGMHFERISNHEKSTDSVIKFQQSCVICDAFEQMPSTLIKRVKSHHVGLTHHPTGRMGHQEPRGILYPDFTFYSWPESSCPPETSHDYSR